MRPVSGLRFPEHIGAFSLDCLRMRPPNARLSLERLDKPGRPTARVFDHAPPGRRAVSEGCLRGGTNFLFDGRLSGASCRPAQRRPDKPERRDIELTNAKQISMESTSTDGPPSCDAGASGHLKFPLSWPMPLVFEPVSGAPGARAQTGEPTLT
jgi:hypothetical protein